LKNRQAMLYMHPYEIDTEDYPSFFFEAAAKASLAKRIKIKTFKLNKHTVLGKLDRLFQQFQFVPLSQLISELDFASLKKVSINAAEKIK
jgi:hypothetical protein